jgi:hypothetical protein
VDVLVVVGGWVVMGADVVVVTVPCVDVAVIVVVVESVVDVVVWVGSGAVSGSSSDVHDTATMVTTTNRDSERVTRRLERSTMSNHFPDFSTRTTLRARP